MLTPQKVLNSVTLEMLDALYDVEMHTGMSVDETPPYVCGVSVSATAQPDTYTLTRHTPELLQGMETSEWAPFATYVASNVVTEGVAYGYIGFIVETAVKGTALVGLLLSSDGAVLGGCRVGLADEPPTTEQISNLTSHYPFLLFGVHHDASLSH
jgi:hypothetical protein